MAICSHCGKEARSGEYFCQYCGRELLATGEAISARPEAVYAASGAPLSWNSSQPRMTDPSTNGSNGVYGAAKAPQARLVVHPSPTAEPGAVIDDGEREFLLDGRDIAVGRAPSCDIVLTGDQLASRRHALLRLRDGSYSVVDLGSSNGTYVNDEEIHGETPLNDGDRVTVGGHDLIFSTAPASADASIAGTAPAPQQSATLLETSPIASVNVPPTGPAADAWHQPVEDAPLAEPDQLAEAGDAGAAPVDETDETAGAQALADPYASADAGEAPDAGAEPEAEESISNAPTSYFVATVAEPGDAAGATAEAMPDVAATDSARAQDTGTDSASAQAVADGAGETDLDALRSQLAEISTALSRKADEEYKLAGRLRAALVEVRDQLGALAREHGGGSYNSVEATQDYSRLANIARQAADHPRHLDYLSSLSDAAGEIADALEAKQASADGGGDSELLAGIEALRARLDETLG
jgi:pSer/pThr/pTyr-binding forkhead associated (FHA) protein